MRTFLMTLALLASSSAHAATAHVARIVYTGAEVKTGQAPREIVTSVPLDRKAIQNDKWRTVWATEGTSCYIDPMGSQAFVFRCIATPGHATTIYLDCRNHHKSSRLSIRTHGQMFDLWCK